jgi:capsular exopolysaccharide synthesis family protein
LQLDTSLKTTEDAEAAFSLPVLAAVPEYEVSGKKEAGELALSPILGEPYSQAAEAFRALRTTLLSRDGEEGRLILVTSALPGEGKSFCALNLGVVLAQTGQRTLLVDAQLRHPVLAHRVIGGAGGQGLSDYLQGTAGFSSVVCGTTVPNLDLVPSGSPTAHPAELLSRQRLSEFTAEALQHYDRVVFDSASIQLVSDTLGFARFFPVVCLVLRAGKTARQILARTLDQIERAGVKPLGLILNRTSGKIAPAVASALHPTEVEPPPGFPLACPGCGRVYRSAEDFLLVTRTAGDHARNAPHGALQLVRECVCGMALGVPTHTRRDFTDMGNKRRRIFGNLHKALIASGFPQEDARDKLLLILKVWRNETGGERENEDSEAAERRSALFDQLADGLATDGESREEARGRLREAIRMWREVP